MTSANLRAGDGIIRRSYRSSATGLVDQDQQTRLEEAYQTLLKQGKLSGRKLAPLAHVHRTTASAWLETRSQKPKAEPPIMEPALTNNETDFHSERHLTSGQSHHHEELKSY